MKSGSTSWSRRAWGASSRWRKPAATWAWSAWTASMATWTAWSRGAWWAISQSCLRRAWWASSTRRKQAATWAWSARGEHGYGDRMISNSVLGEKYVMAPKKVMGDQYVKEIGGSMSLKLMNYRYWFEQSDFHCFIYWFIMSNVIKFWLKMLLIDINWYYLSILSVNHQTGLKYTTIVIYVYIFWFYHTIGLRF